MKSHLITPVVATLFLAALPFAGAQDFEATKLWEKQPGDHFWLTTDNFERGMALNPVTGNLLVVTRLDGAQVRVVDSETGDEVIDPDTSSPKLLALSDPDTGVSISVGNPFVLSKIAVAEDGAIYAANLTTNSANVSFRVYRWADEDANPELVYEGDPSNGNADVNNLRWGDSLTVKGSGEDTVILIGSWANSTLFSMLKPNGSGQFTATPISHGVTPGSVRMLAFGEGNILYASHPGAELHEFEFDTDTGALTLLRSFGGAIISGGIGPMAVGSGDGLPLLITLNAFSREVLIYNRNHLTTEWTVLPIETVSTATTNPNGNAAGEVIFTCGRIYALTTNNGIMALEIPMDPVVEDFGTWIANFGLPGDQLGPLDDPEGDGIPNLAEYAFGGNPAMADRSVMPVQGTETVGENDHLSLTIQLNPDATGITLVVEVSGDLVTWESGEGHTAVVSETASQLVVRDLTPMAEGVRRFIRVRIELD